MLRERLFRLYSDQSCLNPPNQLTFPSLSCYTFSFSRFLSLSLSLSLSPTPIDNNNFQVSVPSPPIHDCLFTQGTTIRRHIHKTKKGTEFYNRTALALPLFMFSANNNAFIFKIKKKTISE